MKVVDSAFLFMQDAESLSAMKEQPEFKDWQIPAPVFKVTLREGSC